jgi:hypothetical protein
MTAPSDSWRPRGDFAAEALDEIAYLQLLDYAVHKEWKNGVELRKKSGVGDVGFALRSLCVLCFPVLGILFFGRTVLDVFYGYKYRAFVPNRA